MRVRQMSVSAIRIKFQGPFELILSCTPIPVVPKNDETEYGVGFGERVVNFDGLLRNRFGLRKKFVWRHLAAECSRAVSVRESDVGERVGRIEIDRLLEI